MRVPARTATVEAVPMRTVAEERGMSNRGGLCSVLPG